MRASKLLPAVAVAATLLALAPAGAAARRIGAPQKGPSGPCRVHLEVPRAPITAGESLTLFGSLMCPREAAGGRQVAVYQRAAGHPGLALVGTAVTEGNGAFSLTPSPFTVNSVFFAVSAGAKSAHRVVRVAPVVTPTPPTPADGTQLLSGGGRLLRPSNRVTFAGKVSPASAGAAVALQRENATVNEEWHRIDVGTVNGNGEYSITHRFVVPGEANIRVVVHPRNHLNVPAASTPVSYEISQAQNPALTIESAVDPLIYGHAVAIKGVVKGAAANTPVTLLAHTRGNDHFAPIATGTTTSGGAYEFTQTPLQNTAYKVSSASTNSAVLFEGVKYALSLSPVAGSAQTGQPATFSGTVLPALVGHVVYLERQGALHLGWHVIDVGTVTAPASPAAAAPFSIAHAFYAPGQARLRIKVPGDPSNQGIASAAFELSVTRAPASTLTPETPGNSKLPTEGQL